MPIFKRPREVKSAPTQGHLSTIMTFDSEKRSLNLNDYSAQVERGLASNPYVMRAVEIRANAVAQLTPVLYDREGNAVPKGQGGMLEQILKRPSPGVTWRDLMHTVQVHLALNGNAYILIGHRQDGRTTLRAVSPRYVQAQNSTDLAFHPVAYWRITNTDTGKMNVPVDQMIHIHGPLDADGIYGVSPLQSCALSIGAQTEARRWNASLMANGGKPGIVLSMPEGTILTDEERQALAKALSEDHGGYNNAGAPLVLEGGMTAQALGATPTDMDYTAGLTLMAREIAIALSVSPELLGDAANKTHANYGEAMKDLAMHTIKPLADQVYEALTLALVSPDDPLVASIGYDPSEIDGMQSDEASIITAYNGAEFLTVNEKRARLGYDSKPDGDTVMVSMNGVPLSEAVQDPMQAPADNRSDSLLDIGVEHGY